MRFNHYFTRCFRAFLLTFFCCFLVLKTSILMAQKVPEKAVFSLNLLDWDEYQKSVKTYYFRLWYAKKAEFKAVNEKSFWYALPTVGLQFGLPSIHIGSRDVLDYRRQKQLLENKLTSIDQGTLLEMNEQLQIVKIEFEKLKIEVQKLGILKGRGEFLNNLHTIRQECCKERSCTPEECKKADLEMYLFTEEIKTKELELKIKLLEFEKIARFGLPNEGFAN